MSAKVTVDTRKVERVLDDLVDKCVKEIGALLVDIADDVEAHAEDNWYKQVRRRTGKTGTALETELRTRGPDRLEAVVASTNKASYMVHRPGPLSMRSRRATAEEYSQMMSQYRRTGTLPEGVSMGRKDVDGQPILLRITTRNPLASDGKTLWSQLVIKDGKKMTSARAPEIGDAVQRAADSLRQR